MRSGHLNILAGILNEATRLKLRPPHIGSVPVSDVEGSELLITCKENVRVGQRVDPHAVPFGGGCADSIDLSQAESELLIGRGCRLKLKLEVPAHLKDRRVRLRSSVVVV